MLSLLSRHTPLNAYWLFYSAQREFARTVPARAIAARAKYAVPSVPVDLEVPASVQARRKGLVTVWTARRRALAFLPAKAVQIVVQGRFVPWVAAAASTSVSALHSVAAIVRVRSFCLIGIMGIILLQARTRGSF
jgi:hypothetical protein